MKIDLKSVSASYDSVKPLLPLLKQGLQKELGKHGKTSFSTGVNTIVAVLDEGGMNDTDVLVHNTALSFMAKNSVKFGTIDTSIKASNSLLMAMVDDGYKVSSIKARYKFHPNFPSRLRYEDGSFYTVETESFELRVTDKFYIFVTSEEEQENYKGIASIVLLPRGNKAASKKESGKTGYDSLNPGQQAIIDKAATAAMSVIQKNVRSVEAFDSMMAVIGEILVNRYKNK